MIIGAHSIIYSKDAEADRAFLRDVIGFPDVDVGGHTTEIRNPHRIGGHDQ